MSIRPDRRAVSQNTQTQSRTWPRAVALVLMLVAGYVAIRYTPLGEWTSEEKIQAALVDIRGIWWTPIVLLVLYAVIAPFGISMFPLTIAGAAFGPFAGSALNTLGIVIGAMTSFFAARALGRDFVVRITGERIRKAERIVNRQGIWPLIQVRFMPIPYPVINFAAALAGVPARRFILASVIGLVPATLIHSYFIAQLIYTSGDARVTQGLYYAAVLIAINLVIGIAWIRTGRRRRARYLALKAARSSGPTTTPGAAVIAEI